MFQTDLIVALQALGSDVWTRFLLLVTALGYSEIQIPLVLALAFGVDLKKGLTLVRVLLVTSIATEYVKMWFALPRPTDIDPAVRYFGFRAGTVQRSTFYPDAPAFLSVLPEETIRLLRSARLEGYGFPSGHSSGTAALCTCVGLLFRRPLVWAAGVAATVLVGFSRVYLGRHFLADVGGGIAIGIAIAACLLPLLRNHASTVLLLVLPLISLALATPEGIEDIGRLFGVNLGYLILARNGLPDEAAPLVRRVLRTVLAGACYLSLHIVADWASYFGAASDAAPVRFATGALVTMGVVVFTVQAGTRLGLFGPQHGGTEVAPAVT